MQARYELVMTGPKPFRLMDVLLILFNVLADGSILYSLNILQSANQPTILNKGHSLCLKCQVLIVKKQFLIQFSNNVLS